MAAAEGLERKAVYWKFGASASGNRFQQSPGTSVFDRQRARRRLHDRPTRQLTNHNDNNNEVLAAEATMMLKEHIVDTYGEIRYTMSDGVSGGSMMQTVISSVMPGLLQGIQPAWSYPDAVSTWMETRECGLLAQFYQTAAGATSADGGPEERARGQAATRYCNTWLTSFINPQNPRLPQQIAERASRQRSPTTRRRGRSAFAVPSTT